MLKGGDKMRNKKQKGFTLIELLVVIAIIGLLASIVLLALNSARAKSRDAKRLADVRQLITALELYYNDFQGYPTTGTGLAGLSPNYVASLPAAPNPPDGSCTTTNNAYTYVSASGTTYTLNFCLGAATGGLAAGVHTASPAGIQ